MLTKNPPLKFAALFQAVSARKLLRSLSGMLIKLGLDNILQLCAAQIAINYFIKVEYGGRDGVTFC